MKAVYKKVSVALLQAIQMNIFLKSWKFLLLKKIYQIKVLITLFIVKFILILHNFEKFINNFMHDIIILNNQRKYNKLETFQKKLLRSIKNKFITQKKNFKKLNKRVLQNLNNI